MRSVLPTLLSLTLLSAPLTGCSKEETKSTSSTSPAEQAQQAAVSREDALLQDPLLKRIPPTSVGFMVLDFEGEGYAKFKASPWASQMKGLGSVKTAIDEMQKAGADAGQVALFQSMFDSLQRLGLVSATGESQIEQVASKVAWFIDLPTTATGVSLNGGVFISGAKKANLKEKLATMEGVVKERGITVTKEQMGGTDGFVADLPASGDTSGAVPTKLYLAANESLLAIATSKATVESLLKGEGADGAAAIRTRPEFVKALAAIKGSDTPLSLAFVSMNTLAPTLEKLSAGSPEGEKFNSKTFPIDAFMLRQSMGDQFTTRGVVVMTPKDDTQKNIFQALETANMPATASQIPGDAALAISFDTKFLTKLEAVLKSVEGEAGAEGFKAISNLKGFTLALRNNDGGSPVPDIFIGLEANNRDDLAKIVEAGLGQGMAAAGTPGMQWMSKDLDGTAVRYFTTIIGVGVYLASPKGTNSVVAASSERAMKDLLAAATNGPTSLGNTLTGSMKDRFNSAKLASTYVNFGQLANVIDTVKGSLAMLTGGSNEMDKALDTQALRSWGTHVGSMSFADGTLKLEATFDAAPPAK